MDTSDVEAMLEVFCKKVLQLHESVNPNVDIDMYMTRRAALADVIAELRNLNLWRPKENLGRVRINL